MPRARLSSAERRFGTAIGSHLAEGRRANGASGGSLANRAGVSLDAIRSIEAGRVGSPGFLVVARLADALGISLDTLAAAGLRAISEQGQGDGK